MFVETEYEKNFVLGYTKIFKNVIKIVLVSRQQEKKPFSFSFFRKLY